MPRRKQVPPSSGHTAFGRRVLHVLGVSQTEIARVLGVSQQAVGYKLRGHSEFTVTDLMVLAKKFDVHAGLFFGDMTMDGEVLRDIYRMFRYAPLVLDAIIDAFNANKQLLHRLGDMAQQLSAEAKNKKGST